MRVVVIGGMNLDILGTPDRPLISHDSTPGEITLRPGGVGRNIAARLKEAGAEVLLITALGNDSRAEWLNRLCLDSGIDLSLSVTTDCPAPCYLCIHDHLGDMVVAVNDMSAMDRLTPDVLRCRMDAVNRADACVLDANLSADTLAFVAENATVPLILDPVSCAKAPRVKPILSHLTVIKPNRLEAEALTGERNVEKAAEALLRAGVKKVFISLGPEGVYFADPTDRGYIPAIPLPNLPSTGAGDALCAGITAALLQQKPIRQAAEEGCLNAHQALLCRNTK